VTQLQDQTLSFVPKIIAMMVVMLYTLPWVLNEIVEYSQDLFQEIPLAL
jgi:flagellar biosynthetic protein FliQ